LQTDSSYRFERGVDFGALERVLARAVSLLEQFASGKPVPGCSFADGTAPVRPEIRLRSQRLDTLLGTAIDFERATRMLERLGFERVANEPGSATFRAPTFRPDVSLEADLIEEVARLIGLDQLPTVLPRIIPQEPSRTGRLERECRERAAELGLSEAVTYSFVSRAVLEALGAPAPVVSLKNPFSEEREVMTTSLLPGLLDAAGRAERHGEPRAALFTVGSVYLPPHGSLPDELTQRAQPRDAMDLGTLPEERSSFALLLLGERPAYLEKAKPYDVYDVKGLLSELVERLVGETPTVRQERLGSVFHPRASARLVVGDVIVGRFGTLHPDTGDALGVSNTVQLGELDLCALERLGHRPARYAPVPRLPGITRDVALEAPESLRVGELEEAIKGAAGDLCESVELFDVFRPDGVAKRSLAFRVVYRDPKASSQPDVARTLTDKEVEALQAKVFARVAELGAVLRA
jgi:phenylalanyl-tRNA synthetase beta chain